MNYESIILELISRVQKLEEEVKLLKKESLNDTVQTPKTKAKVIPEMINLCYTYAKAVYDRQDIDTKVLAKKVNEQTGMNINTANMNIMSIIDMLNGTPYNRILSGESADLCLGWIFNDFGKNGLQKAIYAVRGHINYLNSIGNPANTLNAICSKYEEKL